MTELVVILVIALLIFGPSKLPELARSLGKGFGESRRASYDLRQSLMEATEDDPPPRTRPAPSHTPQAAGAPRPDPAAPAPDDAPKPGAAAHVSDDAPKPDPAAPAPPSGTGSGGHA